MDNKCPCGKEFKYYYLLQRHQEGKRGCTYIKDVKNEYNDIIDTESESENICNICKKAFANKYSMERHKKICINNSQNEAENTKLVYAKLTDDIRELYNHDNGLFIICSLISHIVDKHNNNTEITVERYLHNLICKTREINKQRKLNKINSDNTLDVDNSVNVDGTLNNAEHVGDNIENSHNTINSHNNIEININNPIIYPFGYENINFLTNKEMVSLISSPTALLDTLEMVYSRNENKNHHKRNMNKDQVTIINKDFSIKVLKDHEFQHSMVKQLLVIIQRMFYKCKNDLSFDDQLSIWENIKLMEKIYMEGLGRKKQSEMPDNLNRIFDCVSNLLSTTNEDSTACDDFNEFKKKINNQKYKAYLTKQLEKVLIEIREYEKDLLKVSITDEQLREYWLDPEEQLEFTKNEKHNNLNRYDLEEIYRYKYNKQMIDVENTKLSEIEQSIGDINKIIEIRKQRALNELEEIQNFYKLSKIGILPYRRVLILDPIYECSLRVQEINNEIKSLIKKEKALAKAQLEAQERNSTESHSITLDQIINRDD